MITKQQLGQFFTSNSEKILLGLEASVRGKNVVDPFAGHQDLLKWATKCSAKSVHGYDIDSRYVDDKTVFYNDSLLNPKSYAFVLTNPPYLYQNKMQDNSLLVGSSHTDLYQLSLEKVMESEEGIVIVPINFLSAENSAAIRQIFLDKFQITRANYFTSQVFEDTTYNVVAFHYQKKLRFANEMKFPLRIDPHTAFSNQVKTIHLYRQYAWQIGGEFVQSIHRIHNRLNVRRLEEEDLTTGKQKLVVAHNHLNQKKEILVSDDCAAMICRNIILLKAIDTGTDEGKICLEDIRHYGVAALVSIKTSRNQIFLILPEHVSVDQQQRLIHYFNEELNRKREEYESLFMTNFRDNDRKRISFTFAYKLINHLYEKHIRGDSHAAKEHLLF